MQGVRPYDRLQVVLSLGLANGGFLAREGIWKYTGAIPVMTGSGAQTPTRRQLEIMGAWKTNFLVGFPAYLRHMAVVAREELGIETATSCLAPIAFASHGYDTFHLLMPVFACRKWNGTPQPREGQTLKWVAPVELSRYPMPPADLPLIGLLRDLL